MSNPRIELLQDEVIAMYSENNVLTDYRDINLKVTTMLSPYKGGIYDPDIFGSMFSDRCNCGNIRTPNVRCPRCGSMILDEVQSYRRFGRIELPVFYSSKYKIDKIIRFLKDNFNIRTEFSIAEFRELRWSDQKCMDILQWKWGTDENELIMTDTIDDFRKCSYEGLFDIIYTHRPDLLNEYKAYINKYILVVPMALRAPSIKMEYGKRVLDNHITSVIYKNILYCVHEYYGEVFPTMNTELGKAIFRGSVRQLITSSLGQLSQLMASSKENLARNMQSNRLSNSGRCTIVPDPTLLADEVMIPIHLMYEACRSEFIEYLMEKKNVSMKEAEMIYRTQSDLDEIQQLFKQYIEGEPGKPETAKYVIINRAPTLYAYGMFSCKVKLTYDFAMRIPQVLCQPTNGDFDGDTFSYYSIPKKMNSLVNDALSARNRFLYQKDQNPLFTPTQEILQGLIIATKVNLESEPVQLDSIEDTEAYRKETPGFRYQSLCIINGQKTTLGRAILSEYFDKNIEAYLGSLDKGLTAKNITMLYEQLKGKEDRLERIQKIQEFALKLSTMSGSTTQKISDLYLDIDPTYMKQIRSIENNPKLDDKVKQLKIRQIYEEYQKAELNKIDPKIVMEINETSRAKVSELRDMAVQQLNVGPRGEFSVSETSLVSGMNPTDYANHAIENRALQDIKQQSVPQSGYVTRQYTYLASEYYLKAGEDKNNKGIFLKMSEANGRTTTEGVLLGKSNDDTLVKVRSIVTSTLEKGVITADMIPATLYNYTVGSKVGMQMISALTESLTQAGLKLKHGGALYNFDPQEVINCPEDGTLKIEDPWIIFTGKSGKIYRWPKGDTFTMNYVNTSNSYKQGELLGRNYHSVTPAYRLDALIKLCGARGVPPKKSFSYNQKISSECYTINEGTIHYQYRDGNMRVFVDSEEYDYNPDSIYYLPDGSKVEKHQRICSGILNLKAYLGRIENYVEGFYLFKKQYEYYLDVSSDLIELLYVLLVTDHGEGNIQMQSVMQSIHGSDSFFKSLAFGDARKSFQKIDYQGMDFIADPLTSVILSLVMSNEIK